jgi:hypothetical protein
MPSPAHEAANHMRPRSSDSICMIRATVGSTGSASGSLDLIAKEAEPAVLRRHDAPIGEPLERGDLIAHQPAICVVAADAATHQLVHTAQ